MNLFNDMIKKSFVFSFFIGVLFLAPYPVYATVVQKDLQQWSVVTLKKDLPHHFKLYAEAQPRVGDDITRLDRLLLRHAIGYQVSPSISIWQGYAWTPTFLDAKYRSNFNNEDRLWQQILLENHFKRFGLTNRTRLEERFIEKAGGTAVRARHMLRVSYPLDKEKKWTLIGSQEVFFNLNDTTSGPQSGFDQSRTFLGINRKINTHINVEAGYMADYVNRYNANPDRLNHIIMAGLNVQL
jgi:hypothetical protein